jgi:hypothetical protein
MGWDVQCAVELVDARLVGRWAWAWIPWATPVLRAVRWRHRCYDGRDRRLRRVSHEGRSGTNGTSVEGNAYQCRREMGERNCLAMCLQRRAKCVQYRCNKEHPTRGATSMGVRRARQAARATLGHLVDGGQLQGQRECGPGHSRLRELQDDNGRRDGLNVGIANPKCSRRRLWDLLRAGHRVEQCLRRHCGWGSEAPAGPRCHLRHLRAETDSAPTSPDVDRKRHFEWGSGIRPV